MKGSIQPHPPYPFDREISQQLRDRDLERPAYPQQDREARHLRPSFEVARVRRRNPSRFGELFLRPARGEAELPQALSEDLCFNRHVRLSFNDR